MSARTVIVGDVHGCLDELERLLSQIALTRDDRLVMVGDLVAKGPESVGVVRLLRELGAQSVLGNHDASLLRLRRDPGADVNDALKKAARKLDEPEWAWLEALPYTISLPEHRALVVHAGLVPGVPLDRQKPEDMLTMRSIREDGTASKRLDDGTPWARLWVGPQHVYFGHDAVTGLQQHPFATGLDSGCVYGGRLTACVLPQRELVSVKAKRVYAEPGKAIAARHASESQKPKKK
ncbi:metallophosphoesterase family protein [Sandaracinus amylolyticus]|uniref:metallophosphoesterase family protein n=1 Tax=Sandaracinus amylolyticus TaxID=927083 RepID=UPI001F166A80|nr:metallophosphoesterase family protein [Sandaracinus amylolyticus]UJR80802.1 Metallophosphoesterase [Sandaracinus amylolyticus]